MYRAAQNVKHTRLLAAVEDAGGLFRHVLGRGVVAEELDEPLTRQHEVGVGRVVHEIELALILVRLEVGSVGLARCLDLLVRAGQADHLLVHVLGEIADHLGRVALGVDGDEDRRHAVAPVCQQIDGVGVARGVEGADVGAEGVAEVDQRGFRDHILVSDRLALGIDQFEGAADLGCAARHARHAAFGIGLVRLEKEGREPDAADGGHEDSCRHDRIESQHVPFLLFRRRPSAAVERLVPQTYQQFICSQRTYGRTCPIPTAPSSTVRNAATGSGCAR